MSPATRRYYSSRTKPSSLTVDELYVKLRNLYLMFRDKDYFTEKAGITEHDFPNEIKYKAALALKFKLFPITEWASEEITEDHIFDALEFLYDHVSKPIGWSEKRTSDGEYFWSYDSFDDAAGRQEFRENVNLFLADYKASFELTDEGIILALGTGGLQHILNAEIVSYDEVNVDNRVRDAIAKWRNRHLSITEKREAIRELADVFEWLKKTKNLTTILDRKDEALIFQLANNFGIRHHNPDQKNNYDPAIWYPWMFHFYLATYHAAIRLLIRKEKRPKSPSGLKKVV
jgi:hypothetical protein